MVPFMQEKFSEKTQLQIIGPRVIFFSFYRLEWKQQRLSLPTSIWQRVYFSTSMPDISLWDFGDAFPNHIFFHCAVAYRFLAQWVTIRPDKTMLQLPIKFNLQVIFTEFTLLWTPVIFACLIFLSSTLHQMKGTICASKGTGSLASCCTAGQVTWPSR